MKRDSDARPTLPIAAIGTLLFAAHIPWHHNLTAAISPEDHELAIRLVETGQPLPDFVPKPATG